jgi:hypothetical protein
MLKHGCLLMLLALAAAGCGGEPPANAQKPTPTVFDPLIEKKQTLPAAVEAAQAQHDAETRRQVDGADGAPPEGASAEARR